MTKAKFEIGENEKHTIIVNASALLKFIKIEAYQTIRGRKRSSKNLKMSKK
jgi:hypothetical protein